MKLNIELNKNINLGFTIWLLGFTIISLWNLGYVAQTNDAIVAPYMPYIGIILIIGVLVMFCQFKKEKSMINTPHYMDDEQRSMADFIAGYQAGLQEGQNVTRHIRKTIPNKRTSKKPPTKK